MHRGGGCWLGNRSDPGYTRNKLSIYPNAAPHLQNCFQLIARVSITPTARRYRDAIPGLKCDYANALKNYSFSFVRWVRGRSRVIRLCALAAPEIIICKFVLPRLQWHRVKCTANYEAQYFSSHFSRDNFIPLYRHSDCLIVALIFHLQKNFSQRCTSRILKKLIPFTYPSFLNSFLEIPAAPLETSLSRISHR